MVFPSVDNFLRIFNFYQLNNIRDVKELSKSAFRFETVEKYFEALNYNYDDDTIGLNYPQHKTEIQQALNARLDISKYFNAAGFPGSYSFNTKDCYMFKSIMLDWAGTIKTFQDSTSQCTNAYSLSNEDVDKAIRGFGIDFINSRTVTSLNRRQTFLLSMCDLYKIKGSPQSIVKALNIIGLEDVYITEAWVYPTRDGKKNIEIKWIPVKQPQTFDNIENCYVDNNDGLETEYWSWGSFLSKIGEIGECHWFYKKQEIMDLNWEDKDTYFHLPSLTPYFNVQFKTKENDNIEALRQINKIVSAQIEDYLNGKELPQDITIDGTTIRTSFLSIWLGFIYTLVSYADQLRFNELRKFCRKFGFTKLNTDDIQGANKYLQLIYKLYTYINGLKEPAKQSYTQVLSYYCVTSVPVGYCSYNEVLYWWLTTKHTQDDKLNGSDDIKEIVKPSNVNILPGGTCAEIFWNEKYNYGYYDLQIKVNDSWVTISENNPVKCQSMQTLVNLYYNNKKIDSSDLYNDIRIVHYHTENNIPQIFFDKPFYFGQFKQDSTMDMLYFYNDNMIYDLYYKNSPLFKAFTSPSYNIDDKVTYQKTLDSFIDSLKKIDIRNTDRDFQYRTFTNSFLNYPTSLLREDKHTIYETTLKQYASEITSNYKDYVTHDAEHLNYLNLDLKYPQNKKWNWGVSYGKDSTETYFFINYEYNKWCRVKGKELFKDSSISLNPDIFDNDFGIPVFKSKHLFYHVSVNDSENNKGSYFRFDDDNFVFQYEWNALKWEKKSFQYSEELNDTLTNEYGLKTEVLDNKINIMVPPSDIYPSSCLTVHNYTIKEYDEEEQQYVEKDVKFYFSDTMFKPDSKVAKTFVADRIDLSYCSMIYEQIAETQTKTSIDFDTLDNPVNVYIPVYHDPFNTNTCKNYTLQNLLKYLYENAYTLDINTGYIYKQFNYYLDENTNYLYVKSIDVDNDLSDEKIEFKWCRFLVSREWENNEKRLSIYYKLNEDGTDYLLNKGKRIPIVDCGDCNLDLTFGRVYESERYLKDPVVRNEDYSVVTEDDVKFLTLNNSGFDCQVAYDVLNSDGTKTTKYVSEKSLYTYVYDEEQKTSVKIDTQLDEPLLKSVNYGINQDLLDYVNAKFGYTQESMEAYTNVIIELCEIIQNYLGSMGFKVQLDVYKAHVFSSRLIRNIINFYKPKRDRMLKLTSSVEIDGDDDVISETGDSEYNPIHLNGFQYDQPNYNKKENGLPNRMLIRQELNEYVPFNDLVFLKDNVHNNEVVNYREVYPFANNINPNLEIFDRIEKIDDYYTNVNDGICYANYYCSEFDDLTNGFYFLVSDKNDSRFFSNNNVIFYKGVYTFKSIYDIDGVKQEIPIDVTLERWFVFQYQLRNGKPYQASYISEEDISDMPYFKSNGESMSYCKIPAGVDSYDKLIVYLNNCDYNFGRFQYKTDENQGYIKVGLRDIESAFYIGSFDNQKYNGYYYESRKNRFGMPVYTNKNGKMISFYDLSYVPSKYLDLTIKEYHKNNCNKFWIITDYCQIPDISNATYIAFCDEDTSIYKLDHGISTGETKTFYRLHPDVDESLSDLLFVCGVCGYTPETIADNPQLLNPLDQCYHKKYDMTKEYSEMFDRRISQNTLPVKYEPCSYINFYYGNNLCDEILTQNQKFNTHANVTDIDRLDPLPLTKKYYGHDWNGYQYGSLYCNKFTRVSFDSELTGNLTVFIRVKSILKDKTEIEEDALNKAIRSSDNRWNLYYLKYDFNIGKTLIYQNGSFVETDIDINHIVIQNQCCYICEYAVFNVDIPSWYYDIVKDFGVYAYRKEQSKSYVRSKSNYVPLFNTEMPRSCYGRFVTGLPENVEGDRFSSTDFSDGIEKESHYDGEDRYNTYRWNGASYYSSTPQEISMLWSSRTFNRIYDKTVTMDYDSTGTVIGVTVNRDYKHMKLHSNGLEKNYEEKYQAYFNNGQELKIPSNYISPFKNNVPCWWEHDADKYKTGAVQHRPLQIAVRQKFDEYYPTTKNGGKQGKYLDTNLRFDGAKTDCNGDVFYYTSEIDEHTGYVSTIDRFRDDPEIKGKLYSTRVVRENVGDSYQCCCYPESNIFYDPSKLELTQQMISSHIYHKNLKLSNTSNLKYEDMAGIYTVVKIPYNVREDYDFEYCYSKCIPSEYLSQIKTKIEEKDFTLDSNHIDLKKDYVVILTYNPMCRYYIWEVRMYNYYLTTERNENNVFNMETMFKTVDDEIVYKTCTVEKIYTNYVKCRYLLNAPEDRFDEDGVNTMYKSHHNYDYINQLQLDVCCQEMCEYDPDLREKLRTNPYVDVKQTKVSGIKFRNFVITKFIPDGQIKQFQSTDYLLDNYYLENGQLYVRIHDYWYGPYKYNDDPIPEQLLKMYCPYVDSVFVNGKLYVRAGYNDYNRIIVDCGNSNFRANEDLYNCYASEDIDYDELLEYNDKDYSYYKTWVSVDFTVGTTIDNIRLFSPYVDVNGNVLVNTPFTNGRLDDWNYYVDEQKIHNAIQRYKKLTNRGTEQFGRFGEEWTEDKKDDVYIGRGEKQTVTDKFFIYAYYICKHKVQDICRITKDLDIDSKFKTIDALDVDEITPIENGVPVFDTTDIETDKTKYLCPHRNYYLRMCNDRGQSKFVPIDLLFAYVSTQQIFTRNSKYVDEFGITWTLCDPDNVYIRTCENDNPCDEHVDNYYPRDTVWFVKIRNKSTDEITYMTTVYNKIYPVMSFRELFDNIKVPDGYEIYDREHLFICSDEDFIILWCGSSVDRGEENYDWYDCHDSTGKPDDWILYKYPRNLHSQIIRSKFK